MPCFYDPLRRQIVVNSLKVMQTTLSRQPGLAPLSQRRLARLLVARALSRRGPRVVGLVRDPLARLVSFFGNKFRSSPRALLQREASGGERARFQHCQQIFFAPLGLASDVPIETGCRALLGASLGDVVRWLPRVFAQDAHLWPQSWSFRVAGRVRFRADLLLRLEQLDAAALARELGIDPGERGNPSEAGEAVWLDAAERAVVARVYAEDYARFGYPLQP